MVLSRGRFSAEVAAEIPVVIDDTALQVVPDYRLRGGISFPFLTGAYGARTRNLRRDRAAL
jgi:hypothetical protein